MIVEQIINALTLVLLTMGTPLWHVAVYHLDILDATYANPQSTLVENRVHFGPAAVVSLLDRRSIISIPTNIYVLRGCIHADSLVIYRWSHQERQRLLGLFVLESARYPGIKNTSGMLVVTRSRVLLNAYYALGSAHPLTIFTDWIQTRYTSAVKSMLVQSSVRHQASARSKHSPPQLLSDLPEDTSNFSIHVTPRKNVAYHCPHCEYYCTLPIGHPQREHETSHGSMIKTRWLLDGPTSTTSYELQDHKYGSGDQGSTVLCSMLCSQQGRHAHVDYCRREDGGKGTCGEDEFQHIDARVGPNTKLPKDWISHRLYWARSGFKDPYSRNEQAEFAKWCVS
ncbi:unnamed protein product [Rhizoctonia solani]|nr:unnamed protein product [Rhizoctonia solani]